jgi:hypothetical protein
MGKKRREKEQTAKKAKKLREEDKSEKQEKEAERARERGEVERQPEPHTCLLDPILMGYNNKSCEDSKQSSDDSGRQVALSEKRDSKSHGCGNSLLCGFGLSIMRWTLQRDPTRTRQGPIYIAGTLEQVEKVTER